MATFSVVVSTLALAVSIVTAWLTLLRRGTLRMTQPAVIMFGPDKGGSPQIYVRTLLYSTGRRGQLIENMFLKVRRGESVQNLNFWFHGESLDGLPRGSGLFVPEGGITLYHSFKLPSAKFEILPGEYILETCASLVGRSIPLVLYKVVLTVDSQQAASIGAGDGLFFDWGPDSRKYHPRIEKKPEARIPGLK